jgi:hypothetical protein
LCNSGIRPERELAEAARSGVGVECLDQKGLVLGGAGVDDEADGEP